MIPYLESQKPCDVVDRLSLNVWQIEFPLLVDFCLGESVGLTTSGALVRKNETGADVLLEQIYGGEATR